MPDKTTNYKLICCKNVVVDVSNCLKNLDAACTLKDEIFIAIKSSKFLIKIFSSFFLNFKFYHSPDILTSKMDHSLFHRDILVAVKYLGFRQWSLMQSVIACVAGVNLIARQVDVSTGYSTKQ